MMNKFWYLIVFFISFLGQAQTDTGTVVIDSVANSNNESVYYSPKTFKPNFKDNYTSDAFQYETLIQNSENLTAWDRFWRKVKDAFAVLFDFSPKANPSAFNIITKIIAFSIISFAIYMIIRIIIKKDTIWIFSSSKKDIQIVDLHDEDIKSINFNEIIEKTKQNKNYRLTIRYYFLWFLKLLSEKQIIEWQKEKTNTDYFYEIKKSDLKKEFKRLSYLYEYCWYGEFELDNSNFESAEKEFLNAIQNQKK